MQHIAHGFVLLAQRLILIATAQSVFRIAHVFSGLAKFVAAFFRRKTLAHLVKLAAQTLLLVGEIAARLTGAALIILPGLVALAALAEALSFIHQFLLLAKKAR